MPQVAPHDWHRLRNAVGFRCPACEGHRVTYLAEVSEAGVLHGLCPYCGLREVLELVGWVRGEPPAAA